MWERERAIRFVEKNERLGKMVADLSSGFYERLSKGWNNSTKDNPFSIEEGHHFSVYCRKVILPELLRNLDQNRLRVAYVLSFVDSRSLSKQLREELGVLESITFDKEYQVPKLFRCADKVWGWQCDNLDVYIDEVQTVMEMGARRDDVTYNNPVNFFEFCGCMIGKRFSLVSGYCFQTTEFPQSGAIFVEGVNYILRSDNTFRLVFEVGDGKLPPEIEVVDGVADMSLMGGVWQPTRCLNQGIRC